MDNNFSLNTIQEEQKIWAEKNFPNNPSYAPLLGVVEEVGELSHAYLKRLQNIRGTEDEHIAKMKDAIGDITIFLINFCNMENFNYQNIIKETWEEVQKRDWTNNKKTGV